MPPVPTQLPISIPASKSNPRIILYQQTHHHDSRPISLLPLLTAERNPSLTHLILAAVHLNSPQPLTLNDHPPSHPRFTQLWDEVLTLQDSDIKVLCMLGGAAQGSFAHLDYDAGELASLPSLHPLPGTTTSLATSLPAPRNFETSYAPLRDFIRSHKLDGIDLDVEEPTSLPGIVHLIDRLRADFGPSSPSPTSTTTPSEPLSGFIITLAPVATALIRGLRHLSGFDYFELERLRGKCIDWYNVQFYNGWGAVDDITPALSSGGSGMRQRQGTYGWGWYDEIVQTQRWKPERVVLGLLTNPRHGGSGYVGWDHLARVLGGLVERYPRFGGVMGWEYWGAVPEIESVLRLPDADRKDRETETEEEEQEESHHWTWPYRMRWLLSLPEIRDRAIVIAAGMSLARLTIPSPTIGSN
jgi:Glycosyl hydrolases family 18